MKVLRAKYRFLGSSLFFVRSAATLLLLGLWSGSISRAAIVVNSPTDTVAGTLEITQDISFTVTTGSLLRFVVLDDWVIFDGSDTVVPLPTQFTYSVNGGSDTSLPTGSQVADNAGFNLESISAGDGYLQIDTGLNLSLVPGDIFTLRSGLFEIPATPNFNPQATQTFTGNAFLASFLAVRLSDDTPVGSIPEPSGLLLLVLSGAALLLCRNRRD